MKIAFRLDCGKQNGMGRAVRCTALAAELIKHGSSCVFFSHENKVLRALASQNGIGFTAIPETDTDGELTWLYSELSDFAAVIIDSDSIPGSRTSELSRPGLCVICCDDNAQQEFSCDVLVNGNFYAPGLSYRFGKTKPEMLLGGEYTLLRREFCSYEPFKVSERATRVFVCFGASDPRRFTPAVIYALCSLPGIEITAVLGALTDCDEDVQKLAGEFKNVQVHKNPQSLEALMRGCDIAVTGAGNMVYELCAVGLPSFIIPQRENQRFSAQFLDRNGLMKCLGDWQMADLGILRVELDKLTVNPARRECESRDMLGVISRTGAENTARRILSQL